MPLTLFMATLALKVTCRATGCASACTPHVVGTVYDSTTVACSQITPVLPIMEQVWPSYYGPNEEFWAHEWEKHGTCAEDVFPTQLDYFNTTVELHLAHSVEARTNSTSSTLTCKHVHCVC